MCLARWLFINQLLINSKNEMHGGFVNAFEGGVFVFWKESKHLGGEIYAEMRVLTKVQVT